MVNNEPQKIIAFQQHNSGKEKIKGITEYGAKRINLTIINIDKELPPIIDDTSEILPAELVCDLVLNFLTHPDLSRDLVALCQSLKIPIVSSARKIALQWGYTPVTCCALFQTENLGVYGNLFGIPELEVVEKDGLISKVKVIRGAPCGATWKCAEKLIGLSKENGKRVMGIQAQFFCHADPAGWDPINEKSPVHFAGKVHANAVENALKESS